MRKIMSLLHLSIIIPVFNGKSVLEKTLSILESDARETEVIVVDGGSTDGALELVQQRFPWVRLLQVPNHGWAHASNRGFEIATRDVLVTMNSDLYSNRAALEMMVKRLLEDKSVGAVGPMLLNENGSRQWGFGTLYRANWFNHTAPFRINLLHGACLMMRRDVLEQIGGFDENFFFYNEEFDWCWRAGKAGLFMEIMPCFVTHVEGASSKRTPAVQIEQNRGSLYLIQKHLPWLLEPTRLFFQLLGWLLSSFDPRAEFRPAWAELEGLCQRSDYLHTRFKLSGRGEVHFD
jgi:N-acetylglucosaminyl-diphospho-decaprenol L-rhamnosyltransferase